MKLTLIQYNCWSIQYDSITITLSLTDLIIKCLYKCKWLFNTNLIKIIVNVIIERVRNWFIRKLIITSESIIKRERIYLECSYWLD